MIENVKQRKFIHTHLSVYPEVLTWAMANSQQYIARVYHFKKRVTKAYCTLKLHCKSFFYLEHSVWKYCKEHVYKIPHGTCAKRKATPPPHTHTQFANANMT
jgi:hypothetical protein